MFWCQAAYLCVLTALASGCAHSTPPPAGAAAEPRPVLPFADPYDVVRLDEKSGATEAKVMSSCADYFVLRPKGFLPMSDGDAAAMKVEGARCHVIRALRTAKKPERGAPLTLSPRLLGELPAALAPAPSPVEVEKRDAANRAGQSWQSYDGAASVAVVDGVHAGVTSSDSITGVEILAQADLDGDGWTDAFVLTTSGGTKGSWREVRLHLITRRPGEALFRVVQEVAL